MRGPAQGMANFTLDAIPRSLDPVDLSTQYAQDTVVWRSAPLQYGNHNITVACTDQGGALSQGGTSTAVAGFLVRTDPNVVRECEGFEDGQCLF